MVWDLNSSKVNRSTSSTTSKLTLVPTQPPIQRVPGALSRGKKTRAWGCQLTSITFQDQEWLELNLQSHMLSWQTYWFKNCTFYNEALSMLHPTPKPTSCTQLLTHSHSPYFEAISPIHNLNMCHAMTTHNGLHNVSWRHSQ